MLVDYLRGVVDACHVMSGTRSEFMRALAKMTLTRETLQSDYVKRISDSYSEDRKYTN